MHQEKNQGETPPVPVLSGGAAERLRKAGFPAWAQSLSGVVGGFLLAQSVALALFFAAALYSILDLHPHRLRPLMPTLTFGTAIALISGAAGVLLALLSRRLNHSEESAGALREETPFSHGFARWAQRVGVASLAEGGALLGAALYAPLRPRSLHKLLVSALFMEAAFAFLAIVTLIIGGILLVKAAGALRKIETIAKGES